MLCSRNLLGIPLRKLGEDVNLALLGTVFCFLAWTVTPVTFGLGHRH